MSSRVLRAAVAAALLVVSPIAVASVSAGELVTASATVGRIVDGDTLDLQSGARIRLVQIDAPEAREECYSAASTRELGRLAPPGTRVVLESDVRLDRVDRFGRLLRYVLAGGRNVNVELVRRGAATPWFYGGDRGRYASSLLSAIASARSDNRGMWGSCRVFWRPDGPVETRPK
jgi:endonuclease YncB( thermonuclease family)